MSAQFTSIAIGSQIQHYATITLKKIKSKENVFLDFDQVTISENFKKLISIFGRCSKKELSEESMVGLQKFHLKLSENIS